MIREELESYQINRRLVERNKEKIEKEKCREIPSITSVVKGSSNEFPYTERRFRVEAENPVEWEKSNRRIEKWQKEIEQAETAMEEVESFIASVSEVRTREILTYRYIDGLKTAEIGDKVGYSKGRISQLISKFLQD